ncbi:hypothetical protein [Pseudogracilibacillus auburnensis]|uniref:hypothetical protein n=1 Tax=Pseudogracilibacillus auburnensis TaxID=1494959 RepID=UPI001A97395E|nr:hypothetical protein [Pseudogracilibacillus auburnensis]MBO1005682.1 hypothetical protein [Pseudogracilibacillus auburnensis]
MNKRLKELEKKLGPEHKEIVHFVKHVFDEFDQRSEAHRRLAASNALAGIKVSGTEEKVFYETIDETRRWMLDVLERTSQDIEHIGDKHWHKNFKDDEGSSPNK